MANKQIALKQITITKISDGYTLYTAPSTITIPSNNDGSAPILTNAKFKVILMQGSALVPVILGSLIVDGCTATKSADIVTITSLVSGRTSGTITAQVTTTVDPDYDGEVTINFVLAKAGEAGNDGKDAYTVILSNESSALPADGSGNINPADYSLTQCSVQVYSGTTLLSAVSNVTTPTIGKFNYNIQSVIGGTAARVSNTDFKLTALNASANNAVINIQVNCENVATFNKVVNITKITLIDVSQLEYIKNNLFTLIEGGLVSSSVLAVSPNALSAETTPGIVQAGLSGVDSGNGAVRIWAGSSFSSRNTAPFRVTEDGSIYATKAVITGDITATRLFIQAGADTNVATKDDLAAVDVGGVNLIRNTSRFLNTNWWISTDPVNLKLTATTDGYLEMKWLSGTSIHIYNLATKPITVGNQYTLTVTMKSSVANTITNLFNFANDTGTTYPQGFGNATFIAIDTFQTFIWIIASSSPLAASLALTTTNWAANQILTIKELKLEEGNKSTSYSVAPEDQAAYTDASTIASIKDDITTQYDSLLSSQAALQKQISFYNNVANIGVYFSQDIYDAWKIVWNQIADINGDYFIYINDYNSTIPNFDSYTYTLVQAKIDQARLNDEFWGTGGQGNIDGAIYLISELLEATQKADRDSQQWRLDQVKIGSANLVSNLPINWLLGIYDPVTGAGPTGTEGAYIQITGITGDTQYTLTEFSKLLPSGPGNIIPIPIMLLELTSTGTYIQTAINDVSPTSPITFKTNTNTGMFILALSYNVGTGPSAKVLIPNWLDDNVNVKLEIGNKGTDFSYSWLDSQYKVNNLEIGNDNMITNMTANWVIGETTTADGGVTVTDTTNQNKLTLTAHPSNDAIQGQSTLFLYPADYIFYWSHNPLIQSVSLNTFQTLVNVKILLFNYQTLAYVKTIDLGILGNGKSFNLDNTLGAYVVAVNLSSVILLTSDDGTGQNPNVKFPIIGRTFSAQLSSGNLPGNVYSNNYDDLQIANNAKSYMDLMTDYVNNVTQNPNIVKYFDPNNVTNGFISEEAYNYMLPYCTDFLTYYANWNTQIGTDLANGIFTSLKGYNTNLEWYNLSYHTLSILQTNINNIATSFSAITQALSNAEILNLNWRTLLAKKNILNWDKINLSATPNDTTAIQDFAQFYNTSTTWSNTTIELLENPYGKLAPIWRSVTKGTPSTGNAWAGGFFCNLPFQETSWFNTDKAYRLVVFLNDVSGTGNIYVGFSTHSVTMAVDGTIDTNPYFLSIQKNYAVYKNRWLMLVSWIMPKNSTSDQWKNSELYDCSTGEQIANNQWGYYDHAYRWAAGADTAPDCFLRVSQYISSNVAIGAETQFYAPRFEAVDGTEPSIAELLDLGRIANLSFTDFINGIFVDTQNAISNLQDQVDGTIVAWDGSGVPTLSNFPANQWVPSPDSDPNSYKNHVQDTYYDVDSGVAYRFTLNGSTYSWAVIGSSAVTQALAQAAKAQQTADGKMSIFSGLTVPTKDKYRIGDLWIRTMPNTPITYENWTCISETNPQPTTAVAGDVNQWSKASDWTNDDYAHLVEDKVDITVIDATSKRFNNPNGAGYNFAGSTPTGYIQILTPIQPATTTGFMCSMDIEGFLYSGIGSAPSQIDLSVSFYAYQQKYFYAVNYINRGMVPVTASLGYDVNGKVVVLIGPSQSWSYPKLQVTSCLVSHYASPDSWKDGWNIVIGATVSNFYYYSGTTKVTGIQTIDGNLDVVKQINQNLSDLADIAADNKLTAGEKDIVYRDRLGIDGTYSLLIAQSVTVGLNVTNINNVYTNYTGAYGTLNTYLNTLSLTTNTTVTINRGTFNGNFQAYYTAEENLRNAIVNNISIGGTNLYPNSSFELDSPTFGVGGGGFFTMIPAPSGILPKHGSRLLQIAPGATYAGYDIDFEFNTQYTVSAWVWITTDCNATSIRISCENGATGIVNADLTKKNQWQYISWTFTTNGTGTKIRLLLYNTPVFTAGLVYYDCIKLEKGNRPSDWSPRPEDIEDQVASIVNDNVITKSEKVTLIPAILAIQKQYAQDLAFYNTLSGIDASYPGMITNWAQYNAAAVKFNTTPYTTIINSPTVDTTLAAGQGATIKSDFTAYYQYSDIVQGKLNDVQTLIGNKYTSDSIGAVVVGGANLIISKNMIWRYNTPTSHTISFSNHVFTINSLGTEIGGFKIPVTGSTDYMLSFKSTAAGGGVMRVYQYNAEPTGWEVPVHIGAIFIQGSGTRITTDPAATWILFAVYNSSSDNWVAGDTITDMQFEKGNKATQFQLSSQDVQDDIQIGTTNLLHNGDDLIITNAAGGIVWSKDSDTKIISVTSGFSGNYIQISTNLNNWDRDSIGLGEYVTFSIYCRGDAGMAPGIYLYYTTGGTGYVKPIIDTTDPVIWKWINITIHLSDALALIASGQFNIGVGTGYATKFEFQKIMITRGNKPLSSWTPNALDIIDSVNNIQIGGTNLLDNSSIISGKGNWFTNVSGFAYDSATFPGITTGLITSDINTPGRGGYAQIGGLTVGKQYNFSFDIYFSASTPYPVLGTAGSYVLSIGMTNPGNRWGTTADLAKDAPLRGQWYRIKGILFTATVTSTTFLAYTGSNAGASRFWITNIMIEEGNKPSTWRPSVNDINEQLDSLTNQLGQFGDDSIFLPSEKKVIAAEWLSIYNEYATTKSSSTNPPYDVIPLTTQITNYTNAFNSLASYLFPYIGASISNSNLDTAKMQTISTGVNSSTYRTNLGNYYNTKAALLNAMAGGVGGLIDNIVVGGTNLQSNLPNNWILGSRSRTTGTFSAADTTRLTTLIAIPVNPNTFYVVTVYNLNGSVTPPKLDGVLEFTSNGSFVKTTGATGITQLILKTSATTAKLTFNIYYGATILNTSLIGTSIGVKVEAGNKATDWSLSEDDKATNSGSIGIRYIRDYIAGSNVNASDHWVQIQAFAGSTNRALNCITTGSITLTNPTYVTNGITDSTNYGSMSGTAGLQYVTVDLGKTYYDIDNLSIFHYYADSRRYFSSKTQISTDGVNWITVFDSFISGEYNETKAGNNIPISPIAIQKALDLSKYKTANLLNWSSVTFSGLVENPNDWKNFATKYSSPDYATDSIIWDIGPFGAKMPIWKALCKATYGNQTGGFRAAHVMDNTLIDVTKMYRVSIYVKIATLITAGGSGINYFGYDGSYINTGGSGASSGNQYAVIKTRSSADLNRWMLFVGYILPQGSTTTQTAAPDVLPMQYYCDTGEQGSITSPTSAAAWAPGIDNSYTGGISLRMMQYTTGTGNETWFTLPRFEVCDGTEMTIDQLLNKDTYALEQLSVTNGLVADMSDDNKLTPVEKQTLIMLLQQFTYEHSDIELSCTQFGITNSVNTKYNTLNNYLNPFLASVTTTSNINGTTLRNYWNGYTNEKTRVIPLINAAIKAQSDAYTDDAVNNIQIGGTNLLLQSGVPISNGNYPTTTYDMSELMIVGAKYTITVWGTLNGNNQWSIFLDGGSIGLVGGASMIDNGNGSWSCTFIGKLGTPIAGKDVIYVYPTHGADPIGTNSITKIKLEKGTRATDWTPAPKDIQDQLDIYTSDDIITSLEKSSLIPIIQGIQKELSNNQAVYAALPNFIGTDLTNWNNYVTYGTVFSNASYQGIINSPTTNTSITGSTVRLNFSNYYTAKDLIIGKLINLQKQYSDDYADGAVQQSNIKVIVSGGSPAKLFTFPQKADGTPAGFTASGTSTGAIVIYTPITSSAYMCSIRIKGYVYAGATNASINATSEIDLLINCYQYTSTQITSTSYTNYGQQQFDSIKIGKDSAGRLILILGSYTSTTSYLKIWVDWAQIGHTNPPDSYLQGWSIDVITADPAGSTVVTEITGTVIQNEFAQLVGNDGSAFIKNGQAYTTVSNSGILTGALAVGNTVNGANAGLNGLGTSTTEVRIWAGASYANRASAVFRVLDNGALYATSATITGAITATSLTISPTVANDAGIATQDFANTSASTAVDNLVIGGTNLLLKSNVGNAFSSAIINLSIDPSDGSILAKRVSTSNSGINFNLSITTETGLYTISYEYKTTTASGLLGSNYLLLGTTNPSNLALSQAGNIVADGAWHKVTTTYNFTAGYVGYKGFMIGYGSFAANSIINYRNIKFEEGSKATSWSLNPQDAIDYTDTSIDNVTIGSVNLLLKSNVLLSGTGTTYSIGSYAVGSSYNGAKLIVGQKYTLVVKGSNSGATTLAAYVNGNQTITSNLIDDETSVIKIITFTRTNTVGTTDQIYFYNYPSQTSGTVSVEWACLYEGDVKPPLAWSPAPQDIDNSISAVDTKATNAGTAASNAQSTANTGVSNAATAQTTANNAASAAAAAQTSANTANSSIGTTNTNLAALITKLNTPGQLPNKVTIDANGITATVTSGTAYARLNNNGLQVYGGAILIATSTTSNRGVILDSNGFRAYDGTGVQTVNIDTSGNASFTGTVVATTLTADNGNIAGFTISQNSLRNESVGNGVSIFIQGRGFPGQNDTSNGINGDGILANGSRRTWDSLSYNNGSVVGFLRDGSTGLGFVGQLYTIGLESAVVGINQAGWAFQGMATGGYPANFGGLFTSTLTGGLHLGAILLDRINNQISSSWNNSVRGFQSFSASTYTVSESDTFIAYQGNVNFTVNLPANPFIGRVVFIKHLDAWGNSFTLTVSGNGNNIRPYTNVSGTSSPIQSVYGFDNSDSGNYSNSAFFIYDGYMWNIERQYVPANLP